MKILIDINHPAHVHYFKNIYKIMKERGHKLFIISRNKEIEHYLLEKYKISFYDRGKGENNIYGKILYFFIAIYKIYKHAKRFMPELILSFGTPYPAIVGWIIGIPHISLNDTEHAKLHHLLTDPFSAIILTPSCYKKYLGKKHIRFNGFMELCYLHPNYFQPDSSVLKLLGVTDDQKFILIRFVSWNASHDIGESGLSYELKIKIVKELSKRAKILISSEYALPEEFKKFQIMIPAEKMHDVLNYATLFLGEGATMASECAMLGTPAIYVNSLTAGTLEEQENYGLIFSYRNPNGVLEKSIELLNSENIKTLWQNRRQKMLKDKIDVTAFMIWFIENYPKSFEIMKENPDYQLSFK